MTKKLKIAYFGTNEYSTIILDALKKDGLEPTVIITTPDRPQGRKLQLTPSPVKVWADENGIQTLQPEKLDADFRAELQEISDEWDVFVVAFYGLLLPGKVLEIPKHQTLNVHPSLLPLYRGPAPVEQTMLEDAKDTGVTIIRMDKGMDSGPIVDQKFVSFKKWPDKPEVFEKLATVGGDLLVKVIPEWIKGNIDEQEQDHDGATVTKKIEKKNGELNLGDDPYLNFLKYKAYKPWPGTFFFKDGMRMKITEAEFSDGKFIVKRVIPEGKKEVEYKG